MSNRMFASQPWTERIETLGDPAEGAFMRWANRTGEPAVRYGLNRPPVDMRRVPAFIRYSPDFLADRGLVCRPELADGGADSMTGCPGKVANGPSFRKYHTAPRRPSHGKWSRRPLEKIR